ncbi:MAG: methyltransferase domain-containing protein [Ferruginibacter sp.]|nr:methyltransferase domain-containing protein [Ferruginibacter sp.]
MKNIFILILTSFFLQNSNAQKVLKDSLTIKKNNIIFKFIALSDTDKIVDIGSGAGYSLMPIANAHSNIMFTVQDIDNSTCNKKRFEQQILKFGGIAKIEQFKFVIGTDSTTNLPSNSFTKILMFDVLHEMSKKKQMLTDIKRIMIKNASFFIEENLAHKPQRKQRICNFRLLTEQEFKIIMKDNNFILKNEQISWDTGHNIYKKIFQYTL